MTTVGLDRLCEMGSTWHCKNLMKKFMQSTLRRAFCETVDRTTHF